MLALGALATSCARCSEGEPPGSAWHDLSFEPDADSAEGQRALVFAPAPALPLLVALHGRGESGRGLTVGANAWRADYGLERLHARCLLPPLAAEDVAGLVTRERLGRLNASLAAAPYRGLAIACPYTPDLADRSVAGAGGFGRFVVDRLLPRARTTAGARAERGATGIDGVSMGGRLALFVGLTHPETFGAIGALQPAIRPEEAPMIAELARAARIRQPFALRLVSSEEDPFLPAVRALSEALHDANVAHELLVVPGPHDYVWNRGPGGLEMLLWHERVLRQLPAP